MKAFLLIGSITITDASAYSMKMTGRAPEHAAVLNSGLSIAFIHASDHMN